MARAQDSEHSFVTGLDQGLTRGGAGSIRHCSSNAFELKPVAKLSFGSELPLTGLP